MDPADRIGLRAQRVWIGTTANQCGDWADMQADGSIGSSHSSDRARLLLFPQVGCQSAHALLCLQE